MKFFELLFKKGKVLVLVILWVILSIIGFSYFNLNFPNKNDDPKSLDSQYRIELRNSITDGFWNGLFTVLFLLPPYILSHTIKRQVQHYNSLVVLESQLIEMGQIISDNNHLISGFKESTKTGNIFWGNFRMLPIDKTHLQNLFEINLMQRELPACKGGDESHFRCLLLNSATYCTYAFDQVGSYSLSDPISHCDCD